MNFTKIIGLPEGSDYILLNTIYHKSRKDGNKYTEDSISLILKNTKTNKKIVKNIKSPMIEGYFLNDGIKLTYPHLHIDEDLVHTVDLSYRNVCRDIASLMGEQQLKVYWDCIRSGRGTEVKNFHKWLNAFSTDVNIEDFYRYKCLEHFGIKDEYHLSKGYFDIEADVKIGSIDFKTSTGDAPINAVSFVNQDTNTVYTILLRNENNPLIEQLENNLDNFIERLHNNLDEKFGVMNYNIGFVDDEVTLIKLLFHTIHKTSPDFLLAWNMGFDIPYLMHRLVVNNIDPRTILCEVDKFKDLDCYYYKDTRNKVIKLKTDFFTVSSQTVFLDQMISFAAVRKAAKEFDSLKLDAISQKEVGYHKTEYSDRFSFRDMPYMDFELFVEYNITDTLLQMGIEKKVDDIGLMFQKSYSSATRYNKIFKESVFLRNKMFIEFKALGQILGNNHNLDYGMYNDVTEEEPKEKFEGALNALTHHMAMCG